jgi:hypothetical protein
MTASERDALIRQAEALEAQAAAIRAEVQTDREREAMERLTELEAAGLPMPTFSFLAQAQATPDSEALARFKAVLAHTAGSGCYVMQPTPAQRDEGAITYRVTEAETVYSFYHVDARTPDEAVALVQSSQATLVSESAPREDRRVVSIEVWEP